jgi:hypothetical protein
VPYRFLVVGGVGLSYPLSSQTSTHDEVELGCEGYRLAIRGDSPLSMLMGVLASGSVHAIVPLLNISVIVLARVDRGD